MPRRHTVPPAQRLAAAHSFEAGAAALLGDVRRLIEASRQRAVTVVNAELSTLYWHIGHRVHTEVLAGQRARYGEEIIQTLASQLVLDYGRSFAEKNLRRMVQFAMSYRDEAIVVTLSRQLSWSHFVALLPLKDPLQRDFYAQMARTGQALTLPNTSPRCRPARCLRNGCSRRRGGRRRGLRGAASSAVHWLGLNPNASSVHRARYAGRAWPVPRRRRGRRWCGRRCRLTPSWRGRTWAWRCGWPGCRGCWARCCSR